MGYMVIRGDEVKRVFLDEVAILMIENPAVSLTGILLEKLSEKKIKVIFCDDKRSPYGELVPYYGSFDCSRKLKTQINWKHEAKAAVWQAIIADKIEKQAQHLADRGYGREALLLESYISNLQPGDSSNREGHAAKVYFNAVFGLEFKRSEENNPINAALNYGYSVLLSAFNRSIVSSGYSTELGIHHDNVFNFFNLSSDIMEPFRILVDRRVADRKPEEFDKEDRYSLIDILNSQVMINGTRQTVLNAIDIYTRSVINALLEADPRLIKTYMP